MKIHDDDYPLLDHYSTLSNVYPHTAYAYGLTPAVQHSPQYAGLQQIPPDSPKARVHANNLMLSGHQLGGHQGHLAAEQYTMHTYDGSNSSACKTEPSY